MRRAAGAVAAFTVGALLIGACGLGDKQALTDRLTTATNRVARGPQLAMVMSAEIHVLPTKVPIAPGPPRILNQRVGELAGVIDVAHERAIVGLPNRSPYIYPPDAALLFDGSHVYERRDVKIAGVAAVGEATSNLISVAAVAKSEPTASTTTTSTTTPAPTALRVRRSDRSPRRWLAFDFASLRDGDHTKTAGSLGLNPSVLLRLVNGALTGSVHAVPETTVAGRTRFRMNVSRDKAERRLGEKERRTITKMFRANAIGGTVFPAEVWIDKAGHLTHFSVRLRQSLSRTARADLTVTIDLGSPVTVPLAPPSSRETAVVSNLGQLVHGAVGA